MGNETLIMLLAFGVPLLVLLFIGVFVSLLWRTLSKKPKYDEGTTHHSERIYRDFEFFVKVFMALAGGFRLRHCLLYTSDAPTN